MTEFNANKYYEKLNKLFASGAPVRQRVANKIAAPGDVGVPVGTARAFLKHVNNGYQSSIASYGQYNRLARYSDYNEMEGMAEIASGLDIYADEVCSKNEDGDILTINSSNTEIKNALSRLFYDVLNIEFNLWSWVRNLCKYGDQYLLVDHHPDFGLMSLLPLPINEIEREEGFDQTDPMKYRYRWITQGNRAIEPWQIIHFRLLGNDNFLPYGYSILEPARRPWRQLILMEDAVMVYRIVRSPERRVFYIDVGNIAPQDVEKYMERVKTQLKRNQVINSETGRVDLRYNPMSTDEDYFIPVRGSDSSSKIETLPGGQFTGDIEDLQYIQNKLFAALKIPKSYLGYEQDISSKATLSQEDVRFSRTIQRIQRVLISELNKIGVIHLYSMGYEGGDLVNFEIKMANPSTIAELQSLELWRTKFEVASVVQEGMFDKNFIYKRIWKLSDTEIQEIEQGRLKDKLFDMEMEGIQLPEEEVPMEEPPAEEPMAPPAGEEPAATEPIPTSAEPGLPPPPGEPEPITAGKDHTLRKRDPNRQVAAPNELIKVDTSHKSKRLTPNLKNYAFNMKKTAMDPKRSKSELERGIRNPFGESLSEDERMEEKYFKKNIDQLNRFIERLNDTPILKKTKNLISD
jgi:hypothetical protein